MPSLQSGGSTNLLRFQVFYWYIWCLDATNISEIKAMRFRSFLLFIGMFEQVPRGVPERDQLQLCHFCHNRGAPKELHWLSFWSWQPSQIAFYTSDDFNFDYLTDYVDEVAVFKSSSRWKSCFMCGGWGGWVQVFKMAADEHNALIKHSYDIWMSDI